MVNTIISIDAPNGINNEAIIGIVANEEPMPNVTINPIMYITTILINLWSPVILTMALIALIGTASALGDSGSPASDSTLGPTAGLNNTMAAIVPKIINGIL
jgi:hypothetical protein